jgi:hypothetical protein
MAAPVEGAWAHGELSIPTAHASLAEIADADASRALKTPVPGLGLGTTVHAVVAAA